MSPSAATPVRDKNPPGHTIAFPAPGDSAPARFIYTGKISTSCVRAHLDRPPARRGQNLPERCLSSLEDAHEQEVIASQGETSTEKIVRKLRPTPIAVTERRPKRSTRGHPAVRTAENSRTSGLPLSRSGRESCCLLADRQEVNGRTPRTSQRRTVRRSLFRMHCGPRGPGWLHGELMNPVLARDSPEPS